MGLGHFADYVPVSEGPCGMILGMTESDQLIDWIDARLAAMITKEYLDPDIAVIRVLDGMNSADRHLITKRFVTDRIGIYPFHPPTSDSAP